MTPRRKDCEGKRKRTVLSIVEKLKITDKLESQVPVATVVAEYGIGLATVKDLKRTRSGSSL
jgi:hypothetical protein